MKVCIIGKFPPIQGGISAKTFWLSKGLADRDISIHVVTNANCVEREYFIDDQYLDPIPNLMTHPIGSDIPWHIPDSALYVPRLLDKALEVVRNNSIDIIDTNYMVPYGIVGYLLSSITGIPYILRHGGRDIAKFLEQDVFKHLLPDLIKKAAAVISDDKNREKFETMNPNIHVLPRYIPDENFFRPAINSNKIPSFAYIGKVNHYWKYKSLDKIVEIFSGVINPHSLHFITQGKGFSEFAKFIEESCLEIYNLRKFIHPAHMPALLGNIDYLLYFEKDNPIRDFSNIVCEALWAGLNIITDSSMDANQYAQYTGELPPGQVVRVDLDNIRSAQESIENLINKWNGSSRFNVQIKYGFDQYIENIIGVYKSIL